MSWYNLQGMVPEDLFNNLIWQPLSNDITYMPDFEGIPTDIRCYPLDPNESIESIIVDKRLFIVGCALPGYHTPPQQSPEKSSVMYQYNMITREWSEPILFGFHITSLARSPLPHQDHIILMLCLEERWDSDYRYLLYEFNILNNSANFRPAKGIAPKKRIRPSVIAHNRSLYFLCGMQFFDGDVTGPVVYRLDLVNLEWLTVPCDSKTFPAARPNVNGGSAFVNCRFGQAAVLWKDKIIVHGGMVVMPASPLEDSGDEFKSRSREHSINKSNHKSKKKSKNNNVHHKTNAGHQDSRRMSKSEKKQKKRAGLLNSMKNNKLNDPTTRNRREEHNGESTQDNFDDSNSIHSDSSSSSSVSSTASNSRSKRKGRRSSILHSKSSKTKRKSSHSPSRRKRRHQSPSSKKRRLRRQERKRRERRERRRASHSQSSSSSDVSVSPPRSIPSPSPSHHAVLSSDENSSPRDIHSPSKRRRLSDALPQQPPVSRRISSKSSKTTNKSHSRKRTSNVSSKDPGVFEMVVTGDMIYLDLVKAQWFTFSNHAVGFSSKKSMTRHEFNNARSSFHPDAEFQNEGRITENITSNRGRQVMVNRSVVGGGLGNPNEISVSHREDYRAQVEVESGIGPPHSIQKDDIKFSDVNDSKNLIKKTADGNNKSGNHISLFDFNSVVANQDQTNHYNSSANSFIKFPTNDCNNNNSLTKSDPDNIHSTDSPFISIKRPPPLLLESKRNFPLSNSNQTADHPSVSANKNQISFVHPSSSPSNAKSLTYIPKLCSNCIHNFDLSANSRLPRLSSVVSSQPSTAVAVRQGNSPSLGAAPPWGCCPCQSAPWPPEDALAVPSGGKKRTPSVSSSGALKQSSNSAIPSCNSCGKYSCCYFSYYNHFILPFNLPHNNMNTNNNNNQQYNKATTSMLVTPLPTPPSANLQSNPSPVSHHASRGLPPPIITQNERLSVNSITTKMSPSASIFAREARRQLTINDEAEVIPYAAAQSSSSSSAANGMPVVEVTNQNSQVDTSQEQKKIAEGSSIYNNITEETPKSISNSTQVKAGIDSKGLPFKSKNRENSPAESPHPVHLNIISGGLSSRQRKWRRDTNAVAITEQLSSMIPMTSSEPSKQQQQKQKAISDLKLFGRNSSKENVSSSEHGAPKNSTSVNFKEGINRDSTLSNESNRIPRSAPSPLIRSTRRAATLAFVEIGSSDLKLSECEDDETNEDFTSLKSHSSSSQNSSSNYSDEEAEDDEFSDSIHNTKVIWNPKYRGHQPIHNNNLHQNKNEKEIKKNQLISERNRSLNEFVDNKVTDGTTQQEEEQFLTDDHSSLITVDEKDVITNEIISHNRSSSIIKRGYTKFDDQQQQFLSKNHATSNSTANHHQTQESTLVHFANHSRQNTVMSHQSTASRGSVFMKIPDWTPDRLTPGELSRLRSFIRLLQISPSMSYTKKKLLSGAEIPTLASKLSSSKSDKHQSNHNADQSRFMFSDENHQDGNIPMTAGILSDMPAFPNTLTNNEEEMESEGFNKATSRQKTDLATNQVDKDVSSSYTPSNALISSKRISQGLGRSPPLRSSPSVSRSQFFPQDQQIADNSSKNANIVNNRRRQNRHSRTQSILSSLQHRCISEPILTERLMDLAFHPNNNVSSVGNTRNRFIKTTTKERQSSHTLSYNKEEFAPANMASRTSLLLIRPSNNINSSFDNHLSTFSRKIPVESTSPATAVTIGANPLLDKSFHNFSISSNNDPTLSPTLIPATELLASTDHAASRNPPTLGVQTTIQNRIGHRSSKASSIINPPPPFLPCSKCACCFIAAATAIPPSHPNLRGMPHAANSPPVLHSNAHAPPDSAVTSKYTPHAMTSGNLHYSPSPIRSATAASSSSPVRANPFLPSATISSVSTAFPLRTHPSMLGLDAPSSSTQQTPSLSRALAKLRELLSAPLWKSIVSQTGKHSWTPSQAEVKTNPPALVNHKLLLHDNTLLVVGGRFADGTPNGTLFAVQLHELPDLDNIIDCVDAFDSNTMINASRSQLRFDQVGRFSQHMKGNSMSMNYSLTSPQRRTIEKIKRNFNQQQHIPHTVNTSLNSLNHPRCSQCHGVLSTSPIQQQQQHEQMSPTPTKNHRHRGSSGALPRGSASKSGQSGKVVSIDSVTPGSLRIPGHNRGVSEGVAMINSRYGSYLTSSISHSHTAALISPTKRRRETNISSIYQPKSLFSHIVSPRGSQISPAQILAHQMREREQSQSSRLPPSPKGRLWRSLSTGDPLKFSYSSNKGEGGAGSHKANRNRLMAVDVNSSAGLHSRHFDDMMSGSLMAGGDSSIIDGDGISVSSQRDPTMILHSPTIAARRIVFSSELVNSVSNINGDARNEFNFFDSQNYYPMQSGLSPAAQLGQTANFSQWPRDSLSLLPSPRSRSPLQEMKRMHSNSTATDLGDSLLVSAAANDALAPPLSASTDSFNILNSSVSNSHALTSVLMKNHNRSFDQTVVNLTRSPIVKSNKFNPVSPPSLEDSMLKNSVDQVFTQLPGSELVDRSYVNANNNNNSNQDEEGNRRASVSSLPFSDIPPDAQPLSSNNQAKPITEETKRRSSLLDVVSPPLSPRASPSVHFAPPPPPEPLLPAVRSPLSSSSSFSEIEDYTWVNLPSPKPCEACRAPCGTLECCWFPVNSGWFGPDLSLLADSASSVFLYNDCLFVYSNILPTIPLPDPVFEQEQKEEQKRTDDISIDMSNKEESSSQNNNNNNNTTISNRNTNSVFRHRHTQSLIDNPNRRFKSERLYFRGSGLNSSSSSHDLFFNDDTLKQKKGKFNEAAINTNSPTKKHTLPTNRSNRLPEKSDESPLNDSSTSSSSNFEETDKKIDILVESANEVVRSLRHVRSQMTLPTTIHSFLSSRMAIATKSAREQNAIPPEISSTASKKEHMNASLCRIEESAVSAPPPVPPMSLAKHKVVPPPSVRFQSQSFSTSSSNSSSEDDEFGQTDDTAVFNKLNPWSSSHTGGGGGESSGSRLSPVREPSPPLNTLSSPLINPAYDPSHPFASAASNFGPPRRLSIVTGFGGTLSNGELLVRTTSENSAKRSKASSSSKKKAEGIRLSKKKKSSQASKYEKQFYDSEGFGENLRSARELHKLTHASNSSISKMKKNGNDNNNKSESYTLTPFRDPNSYRALHSLQSLKLSWALIALRWPPTSITPRMLLSSADVSGDVVFVVKSSGMNFSNQLQGNQSQNQNIFGVRTESQSAFQNNTIFDNSSKFNNINSISDGNYSAFNNNTTIFPATSSRINQKFPATSFRTILNNQTSSRFAPVNINDITSHFNEINSENNNKNVHQFASQSSSSNPVQRPFEAPPPNNFMSHGSIFSNSTQQQPQTTRVYAHRAILSRVSEPLRKLLLESPSVGLVELPVPYSTTEEILQVVLERIYLEFQGPVPPRLAAAVLEVAVDWQLGPLIKAAQEAVELSTSNLLTLLDISRRYKLHVLRQRCLSFLSSHCDSIGLIATQQPPVPFSSFQANGNITNKTNAFTGVGSSHYGQSAVNHSILASGAVHSQHHIKFPHSINNNQTVFNQRPSSHQVMQQQQHTSQHDALQGFTHRHILTNLNSSSNQNNNNSFINFNNANPSGGINLMSSRNALLSRYPVLSVNPFIANGASLSMKSQGRGAELSNKNMNNQGMMTNGMASPPAVGVIFGSKMNSNYNFNSASPSAIFRRHESSATSNRNFLNGTQQLQRDNLLLPFSQRSAKGSLLNLLSPQSILQSSSEGWQHESSDPSNYAGGGGSFNVHAQAKTKDSNPSVSNLPFGSHLPHHSAFSDFGTNLYSNVSNIMHQNIPVASQQVSPFHQLVNNNSNLNNNNTNNLSHPSTFQPSTNLEAFTVPWLNNDPSSRAAPSSAFLLHTSGQSGQSGGSGVVPGAPSTFSQNGSSLFPFLVMPGESSLGNTLRLPVSGAQSPRLFAEVSGSSAHTGAAQKIVSLANGASNMLSSNNSANNANKASIDISSSDALRLHAATPIEDNLNRNISNGYRDSNGFPSATLSNPNAHLSADPNLNTTSSSARTQPPPLTSSFRTKALRKSKRTPTLPSNLTPPSGANCFITPASQTSPFQVTLSPSKSEAVTPCLPPPFIGDVTFIPFSLSADQTIQQVASSNIPPSNSVNHLAVNSAHNSPPPSQIVSKSLPERPRPPRVPRLNLIGNFPLPHEPSRSSSHSPTINDTLPPPSMENNIKISTNPLNHSEIIDSTLNLIVNDAAASVAAASSELLPPLKDISSSPRRFQSPVAIASSLEPPRAADPLSLEQDAIASDPQTQHQTPLTMKLIPQSSSVDNSSSSYSDGVENLLSMEMVATSSSGCDSMLKDNGSALSPQDILSRQTTLQQHSDETIEFEPDDWEGKYQAAPQLTNSFHMADYSSMQQKKHEGSTSDAIRQEDHINEPTSNENVDFLNNDKSESNAMTTGKIDSQSYVAASRLSVEFEHDYLDSDKDDNYGDNAGKINNFNDIPITNRSQKIITNNKETDFSSVSSSLQSPGCFDNNLSTTDIPSGVGADPVVRDSHYSSSSSPANHRIGRKKNSIVSNGDDVVNGGNSNPTNHLSLIDDAMQDSRSGVAAAKSSSVSLNNQLSSNDNNMNTSSQFHNTLSLSKGLILNSTITSNHFSQVLPNNNNDRSEKDKYRNKDNYSTNSDSPSEATQVNYIMNDKDMNFISESLQPEFKNANSSVQQQNIDSPHSRTNNSIPAITYQMNSPSSNAQHQIHHHHVPTLSVNSINSNFGVLSSHTNTIVVFPSSPSAPVNNTMNNNEQVTTNQVMKNINNDDDAGITSESPFSPASDFNQNTISHRQCSNKNSGRAYNSVIEYPSNSPSKSPSDARKSVINLGNVERREEPFDVGLINRGISHNALSIHSRQDQEFEYSIFSRHDDSHLSDSSHNKFKGRNFKNNYDASSILSDQENRSDHESDRPHLFTRSQSQSMRHNTLNISSQQEQPWMPHLKPVFPRKSTSIAISDLDVDISSNVNAKSHHKNDSIVPRTPPSASRWDGLPLSRATSNSILPHAIRTSSRVSPQSANDAPLHPSYCPTDSFEASPVPTSTPFLSVSHLPLKMSPQTANSQPLHDDPASHPLVASMMITCHPPSLSQQHDSNKNNFSKCQIQGSSSSAILHQSKNPFPPSSPSSSHAKGDLYQSNLSHYSPLSPVSNSLEIPLSSRLHRTPGTLLQPNASHLLSSPRLNASPSTFHADSPPVIPFFPCEPPSSPTVSVSSTHSTREAAQKSPLDTMRHNNLSALPLQTPLSLQHNNLTQPSPTPLLHQHPTTVVNGSPSTNFFSHTLSTLDLSPTPLHRSNASAFPQQQTSRLTFADLRTDPSTTTIFPHVAHLSAQTISSSPTSRKVQSPNIYDRSVDHHHHLTSNSLISNSSAPFEKASSQPFPVTQPIKRTISTSLTVISKGANNTNNNAFSHSVTNSQQNDQLTAIKSKNLNESIIDYGTNISLSNSQSLVSNSLRQNENPLPPFPHEVISPRTVSVDAENEAVAFLDSILSSKPRRTSRISNHTNINNIKHKNDLTADTVLDSVVSNNQNNNQVDDRNHYQSNQSNFATSKFNQETVISHTVNDNSNHNNYSQIPETSLNSSRHFESVILQYNNNNNNNSDDSFSDDNLDHHAKSKKRSTKSKRHSHQQRQSSAHRSRTVRSTAAVTNVSVCRDEDVHELNSPPSSSLFAVEGNLPSEDIHLPRGVADVDSSSTSSSSSTTVSQSHPSLSNRLHSALSFIDAVLTKNRPTRRSSITSVNDDTESKSPAKNDSGGVKNANYLSDQTFEEQNSRKSNRKNSSNNALIKSLKIYKEKSAVVSDPGDMSIIAPPEISARNEVNNNTPPVGNLSKIQQTEMKRRSTIRNNNSNVQREERFTNKSKVTTVEYHTSNMSDEMMENEVASPSSQSSTMDFEIHQMSTIAAHDSSSHDQQEHQQRNLDQKMPHRQGRDHIIINNSNHYTNNNEQQQHRRMVMFMSPPPSNLYSPHHNNPINLPLKLPSPIYNNHQQPLPNSRSRLSGATPIDISAALNMRNMNVSPRAQQEAQFIGSRPNSFPLFNNKHDLNHSTNTTQHQLQQTSPLFNPLHPRSSHSYAQQNSQPESRRTRLPYPPVAVDSSSLHRPPPMSTPAMLNNSVVSPPHEQGVLRAPGQEPSLEGQYVPHPPVIRFAPLPTRDNNHVSQNVPGYHPFAHNAGHQ